MPVPDNDLETRVAGLEHEMVRLREDAASARALTALADRDVAEFRTQLRGHHQVLSALRETQLEQGHKIEELRREMREGFSTLATGMAQITALLTIAESESDGS